jgi:hypothetical protein
MKLLVQDFLEKNTFKDLQKQHGVYASFKDYKCSLNYDMLESKEEDILAQQCRGLILSFDNDIPGKSTIMAAPMFRFFNQGQKAAADVNWNDSKLKIYEKYDGTLCLLYYDYVVNKFMIATRSVPEADCLINGGSYTFRTLFEKALLNVTLKSFDDFVSNLDKDLTYCFELCSPFNEVIVKYEQTFIVLLAVRNIKTLEEIDVEKISIGVPHARTYSLKNLNEIIEYINIKNPLECEGVVIKDNNFNRIKIKNAKYLCLNKIRCSLSSNRNCLSLILLEKEDDFLPTLPEEIVNNIINLKNKLSLMIKDYDNMFMSLKHITNRKEFALSLNKNIWSAPMFQMFDKKIPSMKYFFKNKLSDSFLDKVLIILNNY